MSVDARHLEALVHEDDHLGSICLRTWASYDDPSREVSTRMMVPPGTAARAAARTF
jgi:hypothetical protein